MEKDILHQTCPIATQPDMHEIKYAYPNLADETINNIIHHARKRIYEKNSIILFEQEETKDLMFLLKGEVSAYLANTSYEMYIYDIKDKTKFRFLLPLTDAVIQKSFYNIVAKTQCEVCVINIDKFKKLITKHSDINNMLLNEAFGQISALQQHIKINSMVNNEEKVLYLITNDQDRFNSTKRSIIAGSLNMRQETLSRIIKKLLDQNLIEATPKGDLYRV